MMLFSSMRYHLLLITILLSTLARGQKYDQFEVSNNELIWEYTYEYPGAQDSLRREVVSMLKSKIFTQNVVRNELGYNGEIRHYQVDCQRYGRSYQNTPLIYWSGEWSGKFVIEVRNNKYRVTIYGLYFENKKQPSARYPNNNVRKGYYINEIWKKGRSEFKKNTLADISLMSLSLRDAFDIRQYVSPVKDWN